MDGVLQAPGGPEEDPSGQFKWGGWTFHFQDELTGDKMRQIMSKPFDLLLGRRTYEIFSAYWPYQGSHPIAEKFNSIRKYVVATTPVDTSWPHSILIEGDVVSELKKLKEQDGPDLLVHGSSKLVQTLLANRLVDELYTWIYPITFGKGKKLFQEGTQAVQWKLTDTAISTTGVIMASYVPEGEIKTGSFVQDNVSEAEIARREKLAREHSGK
jgi:dihydrofolate reductase